MTEQIVHHVHTWGTVIVLELRGESLDHASSQAACAAATNELEHIDALFSTYRNDSAVTLIRQGGLRIADAPALVRSVIDACTRLRDAALEALDISVVLRASRQVLFVLVQQVLLYW